MNIYRTDKEEVVYKCEHGQGKNLKTVQLFKVMKVARVASASAVKIIIIRSSLCTLQATS